MSLYIFQHLINSSWINVILQYVCSFWWFLCSRLYHICARCNCVQLKKKNINTVQVHVSGVAIKLINTHIFTWTHAGVLLEFEGHNLACTLAMISGGRSLTGRCPTSMPLSAALCSVFSQLFWGDSGGALYSTLASMKNTVPKNCERQRDLLIYHFWNSSLLLHIIYLLVVNVFFHFSFPKT